MYWVSGNTTAPFLYDTYLPYFYCVKLTFSMLRFIFSPFMHRLCTTSGITSVIFMPFVYIYTVSCQFYAVFLYVRNIFRSLIYARYHLLAEPFTQDTPPTHISARRAPAIGVTASNVRKTLDVELSIPHPPYYFFFFFLTLPLLLWWCLLSDVCSVAMNGYVIMHGMYAYMHSQVLYTMLLIVYCYVIVCGFIFFNPLVHKALTAFV